MNLKLLYGNVARLLRRRPRRIGWVAVPADESIRAALLARLPRFCRQALRRLGLTLLVVEHFFGAVTHGNTRTGLEVISEAAKHLKPGEQLFFTDGTSDGEAADRIAKVLSSSRLVVCRAGRLSRTSDS